MDPVDRVILILAYALFIPNAFVRFAIDFWDWWSAGPPSPSEAQLNRYLETFKHLATLNVATAAFAVALFREDEEGLAPIQVSLGLFIFSVLTALGGLDLVVAERATARRLRILYYASLLLLVTGLTLFILQFTR